MPKDNGLPNPRLITDALIRCLDRKVPNDPQGRKVVDFLAEAITASALKRNVKTINEIMEVLRRAFPSRKT
jgi:Lhr-like helicase